MFAPEDDTEEYFLFVRKVRKGNENEGSADADAAAAETGGANETPRWLPLGDVVLAAGGDLDLAVAERRAILLAFAASIGVPLHNDNADSDANPSGAEVTRAALAFRFASSHVLQMSFGTVMPTTDAGYAF